jgi:hypothetical protein
MSANNENAGDEICVGVTGHRPNRMPEKQWKRIQRDVSQVMGEIEAFNSGRRPVLLSGLAEGADRLTAFVALGRGWSLRAILAFHRSRFEKDFPEPHAMGEFRALLEASADVHEPRRYAHAGKRPDERYDAVGKRLLAFSEVLIAIWDGEGSRGKGGTVEVIEEAGKKGIPVIWIHAKKAQSPRWVSPIKAAKCKSRSARAARHPAHGKAEPR